jgi:hypothetical protein
MDTVEIGGKRYQECDQQGCQWSVVFTPGELSIPGFELPVPDGESHLVCNFGLAAFRLLGGLPEDCPYHARVRELLDSLVYVSDDNEPYPEGNERRTPGQGPET